MKLTDRLKEKMGEARDKNAQQSNYDHYHSIDKPEYKRTGTSYYLGHKAGFDSLVPDVIMLVSVLEDISAEWCKHPDLRFKDSPLLTRDFCGQCHSWVYVGEKNTADEALAAIKQKYGIKDE